MAVFPRGIKSFPVHRNLIDDVKAEHINDLQAEVVALQEVVGPLVNEVNELDLEMDQDNLEDAATLKSNLLKFKNIADQLLSIRRNTHSPIFQAGLTNVNIPPQQLGPTVPYRLLAMPKPNIDSHRTYNGQGFTAPRTGFYLIRAQVNWDTGTVGSQVHLGFGAYSGVIFIGSTTGWSIDRKEHYHSEYRGVHNNPHFMGYVKRGTRVSLRVNQNSDRTIQIDSAFLMSIMLRDLS